MGSDGRWVATLGSEGIDVAELQASNCGIDVAWTGVFAARFAGEPIKNVALTVGDRTVRGELMTTEHGLEGGAVYALLREATVNELPTEPAALAVLIRSVPVRVEGLAPLERAISTAGGVRFDELDERLMLRSRPGTFVAGEMLDWDAPTGGYLLQATFATGVAAAEGALRWLAGP